MHLNVLVVFLERKKQGRDGNKKGVQLESDTAKKTKYYFMTASKDINTIQ